MTYTLTHLRSRISAMRDKIGAKPPKELIPMFNSRNLDAMIRGIWVNTPEKREFTPLVKQLIPNTDIPITAPFTDQERGVLKQLATIIYNTYGDPLFKYSGRMDLKECARVKAGQSIQRFSPKVTSGSSKRRYENMKKYENKGYFNPNMETFNEAVILLRQYMNFPKIKLDFAPADVGGLFKSHASNVGFPGFSNETKEIEGTTYREYTVQGTKSLNKRYDAFWMTSIPALIIGRDQPGGNTLDITADYTFDELMAALDKVEYKDNKARCVVAIDRLSNNNINVLLKALITNSQFLENPMGAGFRSREDRTPHVVKFYKASVEKGVIDVNVDFSAHDTNTSAEMITVAMDLIEEAFELVNAPLNMFEAITAKTIFTKYGLPNPYKGFVLEKKMMEACIPSGIGLTGLVGFIVAQLAGIYACLEYYGKDYFCEINDYMISKGTFPQIGLGDDVLAGIKSLDDLVPIAKIITKAFGMEISVDSIKTAVGPDFLQELTISENEVYYPSGRTITSAFYSERAKGLSGAEGDMSWLSMIYNERSNPKQELIAIAALISKYDATRLGLCNPAGDPLTLAEFRRNLKEQAASHNKTVKEALGDGDPSKENRYTEEGDPSSDYLHGARAVAVAADRLNAKAPNKNGKENENE